MGSTSFIKSTSDIYRGDFLLGDSTFMVEVVFEQWVILISGYMGNFPGLGVQGILRSLAFF